MFCYRFGDETRSGLGARWNLTVGFGAVCCSCCGTGLLPGVPTEACEDRAKPALGPPRCLQEHNSSQIGEVLRGGPVEEDKFCPFPCPASLWNQRSFCPLPLPHCITWHGWERVQIRSKALSHTAVPKSVVS